MKFRALLLAATAVMLCGCFDGHYDIALNSDGSGRFAVEIFLDKEMSRGLLKENNGKLKPQPQHSSLGPHARTSQRVENGSIVMSEVLDFRRLSDISDGDVALSVKTLGHTLFGATRSEIRFSTSAHPQGGTKEDHDMMGDQVVNQIFKGHEMRVTMHLPCSVESANSLYTDGQTYAPRIEKSWFNGSTVEWRMPITVGLAMEGRKKPPAFTATCWSFAGIAPGQSRAR